MLGKRLNYARKNKGYTAQQMADILGLSLTAYRFYESSKRSPNLETLVKIANILGVSTDYLLCRHDNPDK
ncbi:MAG: helix-turn-helix domain-containing protein [Defluviitaleaceae bacterium]|nr:helix-turn-helix domain-containing protein [Defluviitaleaceae bacterium]